MVEPSENVADGYVNYDEPDIRKKGVWKFSYRPRIGSPFYQPSKEKKWYSRNGSANTGMFLTVWYLRSDGTWLPRACGRLSEITFKKTHIFVKFDDSTEIRGESISNGDILYFSLPGFF